MSFIGDRYEIMASWILNPRQMWRGRDLTSYLQEESSPSEIHLELHSHLLAN